MMSAAEVRTFALILCWLAAACASGKSSLPDYPPVQSAELGSMRNVSRANGIWFGGLPTADDLDLARRRGILRVINLCSPDEKPEYALDRTLDELKFDQIDVRLVSRNDVPDAVVDKVLEALAGDDVPKTLIFCGDGSRSAALFALHRVVNEKVPLEQALVEARSNGMRRGAPEEFVREQSIRLLPPAK
jgi:protein tyrosine phosphatase (PTP) superfamily phosphohydrolase (DUF442 family)